MLGSHYCISTLEGGPCRNISCILEYGSLTGTMQYLKFSKKRLVMQSCSAREIYGTCREPLGDSYVAPVAIDYCRLPTGSWANGGDTERNVRLWS